MDSLLKGTRSGYIEESKRWKLGYATVSVHDFALNDRIPQESKIKKLVRDLQKPAQFHPDNCISVVLDNDIDMDEKTISKHAVGKVTEPTLSTGRITLIDGFHRLYVAKNVYPKIVQWTARVYSKHLPISSRNSIRFEKYHADNSSGLILRGYLLACEHGDDYQEGNSSHFWLESVNPSMANKFKQIYSKELKRGEKEEEKSKRHPLYASLRALLPFEALWDGFNLGSLCHILPLKSHAATIRYLSETLRVWELVCRSVPCTPDRVPGNLVVGTQSLVPALSASDKEKLIIALPGYARLSGNAQINRVLTLATFCEDCRLLQGCQGTLRNLVMSINRDSQDKEKEGTKQRGDLESAEGMASKSLTESKQNWDICEQVRPLWTICSDPACCDVVNNEIEVFRAVQTVVCAFMLRHMSVWRPHYSRPKGSYICQMSTDTMLDEWKKLSEELGIGNGHVLHRGALRRHYGGKFKSLALTSGKTDVTALSGSKEFLESRSGLPKFNVYQRYRGDIYAANLDSNERKETQGEYLSDFGIFYMTWSSFSGFASITNDLFDGTPKGFIHRKDDLEKDGSGRTDKGGVPAASADADVCMKIDSSTQTVQTYKPAWIDVSVQADIPAQTCDCKPSCGCLLTDRSLDRQADDLLRSMARQYQVWDNTFKKINELAKDETVHVDSRAEKVHQYFKDFSDFLENAEKTARLSKRRSTECHSGTGEGNLGAQSMATDEVLNPVLQANPVQSVDDIRVNKSADGKVLKTIEKQSSSLERPLEAKGISEPASKRSVTSQTTIAPETKKDASPPYRHGATIANPEVQPLIDEDVQMTGTQEVPYVPLPPTVSSRNFHKGKKRKRDNNPDGLLPDKRLRETPSNGLDTPQKPAAPGPKVVQNLASTDLKKVQGSEILTVWDQRSSSLTSQTRQEAIERVESGDCVLAYEGTEGILYPWQDTPDVPRATNEFLWYLHMPGPNDWLRPRSGGSISRPPRSGRSRSGQVQAVLWSPLAAVHKFEVFKCDRATSWTQRIRGLHLWTLDERSRVLIAVHTTMTWEQATQSSYIWNFGPDGSHSELTYSPVLSRYVENGVSSDIHETFRSKVDKDICGSIDWRRTGNSPLIELPWWSPDVDNTLIGKVALWFPMAEIPTVEFLDITADESNERFKNLSRRLSMIDCTNQVREFGRTTLIKCQTKVLCVPGPYPSGRFDVQYPAPQSLQPGDTRILENHSTAETSAQVFQADVQYGDSRGPHRGRIVRKKTNTRVPAPVPERFYMVWNQSESRVEEQSGSELRKKRPREGYKLAQRAEQDVLDICRDLSQISEYLVTYLWRLEGYHEQQAGIEVHLWSPLASGNKLETFSSTQSDSWSEKTKGLRLVAFDPSYEEDKPVTLDEPSWTDAVICPVIWNLGPNSRNDGRRYSPVFSRYVETVTREDRERYLGQVDQELGKNPKIRWEEVNYPRPLELPCWEPNDTTGLVGRTALWFPMANVPRVEWFDVNLDADRKRFEKLTKHLDIIMAEHTADEQENLEKQENFSPTTLADCSGRVLYVLGPCPSEVHKDIHDLELVEQEDEEL